PTASSRRSCSCSRARTGWWTRTSPARSPTDFGVRSRYAGIPRCITKSSTIRNARRRWRTSSRSSTGTSRAPPGRRADEFALAVLAASFVWDGEFPVTTARRERHSDCLVKRKPMKHHTEQPQPAQQPGAADPPAPPAPPAASEGALVELPEEAVARLEGELAELKDKYLRLAAEYDNFRKRSAKERAEVWGKAQADVVQRLVDGLDDLARFAHVDRAQADAKTIHDGVEL